MLEVLYHHAEISGAWTSSAAGAAKTLSFICLFVHHVFERKSLCTPFRHKVVKTILIPLDRGRFVVVHSRSTVSTRRQIATPQNAEFQEKSKILCFSLHE